LLATVAQDAEPGYTEDDFFGVTMYWSHHDLADYKAMIQSNGLTVLESTIISHGYEDQERYQTCQFFLTIFQSYPLVNQQPKPKPSR
jgi:hypothetical protein